MRFLLFTLLAGLVVSRVSATLDAMTLRDCEGVDGDNEGTDEPDDDLCDAGYTCQAYVSDGVTDGTRSFGCRHLTGQVGAECTGVRGCAEGLLCIADKCTALDTLYLTTEEDRFDTLPKGVTVLGAANGWDELTTPEKIHYEGHGTYPGTRLRCKAAFAHPEPLVVRDDMYQTTTLYPACMPKSLRDHHIHAVYQNDRLTVIVDHPEDAVGWALTTDTLIQHSDIDCIGATVDVVELETTNENSRVAWMFYGSILYDSSATSVRCEIRYPIEMPAPNADVPSTMFVWITPVYISDADQITIENHAAFPPIQMIQHVQADAPYPAPPSVPRGTTTSVITPAQNGCNNRKKFPGFDQVLTLDQLLRPDRDDMRRLDGDGNGVFSPIDIDLAIARRTGFGMSLCSSKTNSATGKQEFIYKQNNPHLHCFIAFRSEHHHARLVPCHAEGEVTPQSATGRPADNVYTVKVKVPEGENAYLVFMSDRDNSDIYQLSSSGFCGEHRNLRACTTAGTNCTMISSACQPLGVHLKQNAWSFLGGAVITAICILILEVILSAFNHANQTKHRRGGSYFKLKNGRKTKGGRSGTRR